MVVKVRSFTTHTGVVVTGGKLQAALDHVAAWYRGNAVDTYLSDDYGSGVSESIKRQRFIQQWDGAEQISQGFGCHSFTIRQRLDSFLTGETVSFL